MSCLLILALSDEEEEEEESDLVYTKQQNEKYEKRSIYDMKSTPNRTPFRNLSLILSQ
jgi:hypothetical protein